MGRVLRVLAWALLGLVAGSVLLVAVLRFVDPPLSSFMLQDRIGALANGGRDYRFRHEWVDWQSISPHAAVAVVAAEDQKFATHLGFDLEAIDRAMRHNQRGKRIRGGSTISQQVAKNLFLWPGQNLVRKGIEAWFTLWIEVFWPKQRILEVYLNIAEFGRGTWGVGAASRRFFHKPAKQLTRPEAALLAAVLPNPRRFRVDAPSGYVLRRQRWILRQMAALGGRGYLESFDESADDRAPTGPSRAPDRPRSSATVAARR